MSDRSTGRRDSLHTPYRSFTHGSVAGRGNGAGHNNEITSSPVSIGMGDRSYVMSHPRQLSVLSQRDGK